MEIVNFATADDMVSVIDGYVKNRKADYIDIDIVAHYEYIAHLLESLIRQGYTVKNIDLTDQVCSGYCKEDLLSLFNEEIYIQPMWYDKEDNSCYAESWSYIAFIHQDCNAALLPSVKADIMYDFSIQEYDAEDDSYHFSAAVTNDNKTCAISFSSSNQSDVDEIKKIFYTLTDKR